MGSAARAADFYMIYVQTEGDDKVVELLDPSSVQTLADGHKMALVSNISEFDLWQNDGMEFDCSRHQYQILSATSHVGGEDIDVTNIHANGWEPAKPDEIDGAVYDTVCNWTPDKLTGSAVYSAADFKTAQHLISDRLYELGEEKK